MSQIMQSCRVSIERPECPANGRHIANIITFVTQSNSADTVQVKLSRANMQYTILSQLGLMTRIWCDRFMYDHLVKLAWVRKGRQVDLDLVVFDCPAAKNGQMHQGYFGFGAIFLIMSLKTPGFIVDMFFNEIDSRDSVTASLKILVNFLNSGQAVPDFITANYRNNELAFVLYRQYRSLQPLTFNYKGRIVQLPIVNESLIYFKKPIPLTVVDKYLSMTSIRDRAPGHYIRPSHQWATTSEFPWNWQSRVLNQHYIGYALQNEFKLAISVNFSIFNHFVDMITYGVYPKSAEQQVVNIFKEFLESQDLKMRDLFARYQRLCQSQLDHNQFWNARWEYLAFRQLIPWISNQPADVKQKLIRLAQKQAIDVWNLINGPEYKDKESQIYPDIAYKIFQQYRQQKTVFAASLYVIYKEQYKQRIPLAILKST